jgi:iron(III) transport system ATP-binding protein
MGTPVTLDRLTKTYPAARGQAPLRVVDEVSLEIAGGEMFFLLGPSGCGKTTLLRMIAGFIEPDNGRILFGSREVTFVPAQNRNTGMVFQSYATWPHMTVRSNVSFGLETRKMPAAQAAARVNEALEMVQMEHLGDRKPTQLSGGQQQRVALARAIAVRPDVLLLDEPLSNLDAKLRVELRTEIRRACKAEGITGIYVTHDQREAMSIGDRIALMKAGKIEQIGSPTDLYLRPTSVFAADFMGETNLFHGELRAVQNGRCEVQTPVGVLTGAGSAAVGSKVAVSIRPEAIRFVGSADRGGGGGRNVVQEVALAEPLSFLGEVWHLSFKKGDALIRMTGLGAPPAELLNAPTGFKTSLEFDHDATRVLAE